MYGKQLLDLCQAARLRILNGRTGHNRKIGKFTCHRAHGSSVVDYVIASVALIPLIIPLILEFIVQELSFHSDHCPLYFNIDGTINATFRLHCISNATTDMLKDSADRDDDYSHMKESSSHPSMASLHSYYR